MNHIFMIIAAVVASTGFAHAQGLNDSAGRFSLDLITISVADESQSLIASGFNVAISQMNTHQTANQAKDIFSSFDIHVLVSAPSNESNSLIPSLIGDHDNQLNFPGLNNIRPSTIPDNLTVVPLPSAALAGLGMLGGIMGIRHLRNKK